MNNAPNSAGARRRRSLLILIAAAALAAAMVMSGWFVIAPDRPDGKGGDVGAVPDIFPLPQHTHVGTGGAIPLSGHVYVVASEGTDQASIAALVELVSGAGGTAETVTTLSTPREGSSAVRVGTDSTDALRALHLDGDPEIRTALERPEGYA
ncbi:hypothetical protein AB4Y88_16320, partial [Paenarthrobacter sp. RAF9]